MTTPPAPLPATRPDLYVLNAAGEPEPTRDVLAWASWYETGPRGVASTAVGEARVSTVFLGIDHSFSDTAPPVLWETLVFGGPLDGEMARYLSRAEALAGHAELVARCQAAT